MSPYLAKLALNTEFVKYTVLILTIPLWWPFVRELWRELNDILAEEGGLLGRKPSDKELARIRRSRAAKEADLVRELNEQERGGKRRSGGAGLRRPYGASTLRNSAGASGPSRPPPSRGFGPPR